MDFNDYQKKAVRTWGLAADVAAQEGNDTSTGAFLRLANRLQEIGVSETDLAKIQGLAERLNISALANGLTGEAGEVADEIKKFAGHGHWKDGVDLEKEIGDVLWYAAAIAECMGFSLDEIAKKNISKLESRYKDGFSTQNSIDRVDLRKQITEIRKDIQDQLEDPRSKRISQFLQQTPGHLRFSEGPPLARFLGRMEMIGARIHCSDDPAIPSLGWTVQFGKNGDTLQVEIRLQDFKQSPVPGLDRFTKKNQ